MITNATFVNRRVLFPLVVPTLVLELLDSKYLAPIDFSPELSQYLHSVKLKLRDVLKTRIKLKLRDVLQTRTLST